MSDRIKKNTETYLKTEWATGDIITEPKMMNIEDWMGSVTDEIKESRSGRTISGGSDVWSNLNDRLEHITRGVMAHTESGALAILEDVNSTLTSVSGVMEEATDATYKINNITVSAAPMVGSGPEADVYTSLSSTDNKEYYDISFKIPVVDFTVKQPVHLTSISSEVNVSFTSNSDAFNKELDFTMPVPTFVAGTTNVVSASSAHVDVVTDGTNKLKNTLNFSLPKLEIGDINVYSTGSIDENSYASFRPNSWTMDLNVPVLKTNFIYKLGEPGTPGVGRLINAPLSSSEDPIGIYSSASELNLYYELTVPVLKLNINQANVTTLPYGSDGYVLISYDSSDTEKLNPQMIIGMPTAKGMVIQKYYETLGDLVSGMANDEVDPGNYGLVIGSSSDVNDTGLICICLLSAADGLPNYRALRQVTTAAPQFSVRSVENINNLKDPVVTIDNTYIDTGINFKIPSQMNIVCTTTPIAPTLDPYCSYSLVTDENILVAEGRPNQPYHKFNFGIPRGNSNTLASKNDFGVVKIGDGIEVNNGIISYLPKFLTVYLEFEKELNGYTTFYNSNITNNMRMLTYEIEGAGVFDNNTNLLVSNPGILSDLSFSIYDGEITVLGHIKQKTNITCLLYEMPSSLSITLTYNPQ